MAGRKVTYIIDVDESGAVTGSRRAGDELDNLDKQSTKTSKGLNAVNVAAAAMVAGLGLAVAKGVTRAIEKGREFESQLAELEAITGITGTQLERLGNRSIELSTIYGVSASNIIEANKLVASQLAEKIDFGTEEGFQVLQRTSEQAVILAKAAGIELAEAVNTTTSVINQFNLEASESERVINTLAAGSKYGAAEVPQIGRALVNAGSAAASANQSIEMTNAAIQVLAANGQVGERAGTALRAIFLRLQTSGESLAKHGIEEVDIKSNGLVKTLQQLEPMLEDTAAMKQIFGEEAINAAQILIQQADSVENLTEKVTDTQTAHEQAAVNMDTFDGAAAILQETINKQLIPAFTESSGALVKMIGLTTDWIDYVGSAVRQLNVWVDSMSEIRRETGLATSTTDAQISSMQSLQKELAQAAIDGDLTIEQEKELREAYDQTNESLQSRHDSITSDTEALIEQREESKKRLEDLQENILSGNISGQGVVGASKEINLLQDELEATDLKIANNESRLIDLSKALQQGKIGWEEYKESVRLANEASDDSADKADNQAESLAGLNEIIKENNAQISSILNKQGELTQAEEDELIRLSKKNREYQEQIDLRKQLMQIPDRPSAPVETPESDIIDVELDLPDSSTNGVIYDEKMAREAELTALIRQESLARQNVMNAETEAEQEAAQASLDMMTKEIDMRLMVNDVYQQSAMANITTANELLAHTLNTTRQVIQAKVAEATAEQVLKVLKSVPFPLNIAAAALAGGTISLLFNKVIPSFRTGVDNFEGGVAKVHKDELITYLPKGSNVITNANTSRIEEALTFNAIPRGGDPLPTRGESSTDIAAAIREGMRGVVVEAKVAVTQLSEEIDRYKQLKEDLG